MKIASTYGWPEATPEIGSLGGAAYNLNRTPANARAMSASPAANTNHEIGWNATTSRPRSSVPPTASDWLPAVSPLFLTIRDDAVRHSRYDAASAMTPKVRTGSPKTMLSCSQQFGATSFSGQVAVITAPRNVMTAPSAMNAVTHPVGLIGLPITSRRPRSTISTNVTPAARAMSVLYSLPTAAENPRTGAYD